MCVWHRYHFDGTSRRFFEGWYFKVSIPEAKQSFAWMYTSENPGAAEVEPFNMATSPCGAAQVMGADEEYLLQDAPTIKNFWGGQNRIHCQFFESISTTPTMI